MTQTSDIQSWIAWAREHLPASGDIPKISVARSNFAVPWDDEYWWLFNHAQNVEDPLPEWLSCFADELSGASADPAVRFTALNLYHKLAHYDGYPYHEDEVSIKREGFEKQLILLVGFLKVEECPADWRIFRWEILNSYAIRDLDRARDLYNRAVTLELLDRSDLLLLRGQFAFLAVFGPKLDNEFDLFDWEPKLYGPQDFPKDMLFFWGFLHDKPEISLSELERKMLLKAKNDFEEAIVDRPDVLPMYRLPLAKCCFSTDHFHDAIAQYQWLLNSHSGNVFQEQIYQEERPALRKLLYESLIKCYLSVHERRKAIETLEQQALEYPNENGIYLQIAKLLAYEKDLPAIAECIRKEEERDPHIGEDPILSTLLIAGETWENSEADKSRLRAKPEYEPLVSLLKEYWPPFAVLGEKASEEWVFGIMETHFCAVGGRMRDTYLRKANAAFAQAVELELSSKIFVEFRKCAAPAKVRPLAIQAVKEENKELTPFANFVLGKSELGIGQMAYILDHSGTSKYALFQEFAAWVRSNYPSVLERVARIYDIAKFRNPALHQSETIGTIEHIPSWCREAIDALCPRSVGD